MNENKTKKSTRRARANHAFWILNGGDDIGDGPEKKKLVPGKGVPFLCLLRLKIESLVIHQHFV
jgi:hypothetical protein